MLADFHIPFTFVLSLKLVASELEATHDSIFTLRLTNNIRSIRPNLTHFFHHELVEDRMCLELTHWRSLSLDAAGAYTRIP